MNETTIYSYYLALLEINENFHFSIFLLGQIWLVILAQYCIGLFPEIEG